VEKSSYNGHFIKLSHEARCQVWHSSPMMLYINSTTKNMYSKN